MTENALPESDKERAQTVSQVRKRILSDANEIEETCQAAQLPRSVGKNILCEMQNTVIRGSVGSCVRTF